EVDEIIGLADRVLEKRDLEREVVSLRSALAGGGAETSVGFEGLVGRHPEMARLYQLITQIAPTPTTVLITGESGTGKELVARAAGGHPASRGALCPQGGARLPARRARRVGGRARGARALRLARQRA